MQALELAFFLNPANALTVPNRMITPWGSLKNEDQESLKSILRRIAPAGRQNGAVTELMSFITDGYLNIDFVKESQVCSSGSLSEKSFDAYLS